MEILLIALFALAVKLPVLWFCWFIYRTIQDVPQPELRGDGNDFVRAEFAQGPRRRGPQGNGPALAAARRLDKGHDSPAPERRGAPSLSGD